MFASLFLFPSLYLFFWYVSLPRVWCYPKHALAWGRLRSEISQMPSLKEASGDILAFSTLLGHDGREKETESIDSVSDTSVKNAIIPSKISLEATRMCSCWTMKSSQREVRFHPWQRYHGCCRNIAGIWQLGNGGWNYLLFLWGV